MEFRRSFASEKLLLTHPFKLNLLATLRVRNGDVMVFLTAVGIPEPIQRYAFFREKV